MHRGRILGGQWPRDEGTPLDWRPAQQRRNKNQFQRHSIVLVHPERTKFHFLLRYICDCALQRTLSSLVVPSVVEYGLRRGSRRILRGIWPASMSRSLLPEQERRKTLDLFEGYFSRRLRILTVSRDIQFFTMKGRISPPLPNNHQEQAARDEATRQRSSPDYPSSTRPLSAP